MSEPEKKHVFLKVLIFGLCVNAFFIWLGNSIPQLRKESPKDISFKDLEDKSPEEIASLGKDLFNGKGTCFTCHSIGEGFANRCPNLGAKNGLSQIGTRAAERLTEGDNGTRNHSPEEYLAESLYIPTAYIVKDFPPIMPAVNKPPLALTDAEIVAVVAFLQSQGSKITVTAKTRFDSVIARIPKPVKVEEIANLKELLAKANPEHGAELYKSNCMTCHGDKGDGKGPGGSSLNPPPRNFTDVAKMKEIPHERMFKVVKFGGQANGLSALMAAFSSTLTDQDIADVIVHERRFAWPAAKDDPDVKP